MRKIPHPPRQGDNATKAQGTRREREHFRRNWKPNNNINFRVLGGGVRIIELKQTLEGSENPM